MKIDFNEPKVKTFSGPGKREENTPQPGHSGHKWRNIRWGVLLFFNLLFFVSFFMDIQILEGSLSGSRLLGFHLIDPLAAVQVILASRILVINLVIGVTTIILIYVLFGGRTFCAWICPYHWLAELGEKIHLLLKKKKIIKNHSFDKNIRIYFFVLFIVLSLITGFTVFETINPVGILSRFIVYGPSLMLSWVLALLLFEVFYSRRAWCRYFCPVSVSYHIIGLATPLRIKWDREKCSNCKRCQQVCLVPHVLTNSVNKGVALYVDSGACTRCGLCIDICDDEALGYGLKYLDNII
ncbi:MAG: NapH/MauN family ferredoxin-type protein [Deltaproteobacteria bacterium]|jgi:ferredoxin-type protein NapH|nr:NapH/MauN family ferredoxin-type protein [Deltaproteobacteria bacterium]MBT4087715.1 NapH/MauN family ferredoxin-type protein [Deltaproteobacteria bacterium]MBT4263322.1 NapH/MauN family ferredoxin-type protein [Deltaproteobacteria bacterium]MBT4641554.1 NapH/MauN family ferredoxin-type protein [Deltaproteobacteria bacterium]MBT6504678.1 NapH/MauN family ferredoxin-type protein [Deltaproteobacteria bacterium]